MKKILLTFLFLTSFAFGQSVLLNLFDNNQTIYYFTIDGQPARLVLPDTYTANGDSCKLVIYMHGQGGTYLQLPYTVGWYDSLRNNNYAIATMTAGNLWGNSTHQARYVALYNYVIQNFNVIDSCYLISQSMGSLCMLNIIAAGTIPVRSGALTSGVVSLDSVYKHTILKPGIQTAYNFSTDEEMQAATEGFDPLRRLVVVGADTTYSGTPPLYLLHGSIDTVASIYAIRSFYSVIKKVQITELSEIAGVGHASYLSTATEINNILNFFDEDYLFSYYPSYFAEYISTNVTMHISDTLVITWDDISGNSRDISNVSSVNLPAYKLNMLNGKPILKFTGDDWLVGTFTIAQPLTIYIVFKQKTWTLNDRIFDGKTTASLMLSQNGTTPNLRIYAGSFITENTTLPVDTWGIASCIFNGASSSLQINDLTPITGNVGTATPTGFTIGGGDGGSLSDIEVAHIIIFNAVHSSDVKSKMIQQLNLLWDVY